MGAYKRNSGEVKERSDGESWMYDEDVKNAIIKEFAKAQGDTGLNSYKLVRFTKNICEPRRSSSKLAT